MIKNKLIISAMVLSLLGPTASFAEGSNKITIENPNYKLEKYEPRKGAYLGAYTLQDSNVYKINGSFKKQYSENEYLNMINEFENSVTVGSVKGLGEHAAYFKYFGYVTGDKVDLNNWMSAVISADGIPHIALEPQALTKTGNALDSIQNDEKLRDFAKMLGAYDRPIFLRYASEMNGDWAPWHGDKVIGADGTVKIVKNSTAYKEKWRIVANVMHEYAPNVIMTWVPFPTPERYIDEYYPGDAYVDWVGVNVYNTMYTNGDINKPTLTENTIGKLDYVYNKYGYKKPIFVGELGIAHESNLLINNVFKKYNNITVAKEKLSTFYNGIQKNYPRVKAVFYFDVNNMAELTIPERRRISNYSLTTNPLYASLYKSLTSSEYFIKKVDASTENEEGSKELEDIVLPSGRNGNFVSIRDIANVLGGTVKEVKKNGSIYVEFNILNKNYSYKVDNKDGFKSNGINYINMYTFDKLTPFKLVIKGTNYKFIYENGGSGPIISDDMDNHWAKDYINNFKEKGYIGGYDDGTFRPNNSITRAEFVTVFNKAFGLTNASGKVFSDTQTHWAKYEIDKAVSNGICSGKTDTEFKPNDPITREEAAVMISNYKKLLDTNYDKINQYKDKGQVSNWAKNSVEGLIEKGYMSGYSDGTFRPKGKITRAEAVVTLSRLIQ